MDTTAAALADLRVSLGTASSAYTAFARRVDMGEAHHLLEELALERRSDGSALDRAARSVELESIEPTIDGGMAAELLGLGRSLPTSANSVAYRVQRAENALSGLVSQLLTVTPYAVVRAALGAVRERIATRRGDVRKMRTLMPDRLAFGVARAALPPDATAIPGEEVTVWFGTNRAQNAPSRFTAERDQTIHYGKCRVFMPANRPIGSLGSGLLGRLVGGGGRVRVVRTEVMPSEQFWIEVVSASDELERDDRQALVFLHGYCTKFDDAACRTAQLKADLQHRGPTAFFSWPSLGAKHGYTGDEAAIEGSEDAIRSFLIDFAERSGAEAVHIIAHSMGNRGLLRAMDKIAHDAASVSRVRFGQIVLSAPDVDTALFLNLASAYTQLAARSTLYVSENDRAIGISKAIHRFPRVGRAPPVVVVPGIDTINVSKVNLSLIGHGYAAEIRPVLTDIYELIRRNTPPDQRFGIRRTGLSGAEHWVFQP